jgi:hypothetical protein
MVPLLLGAQAFAAVELVETLSVLLVQGSVLLLLLLGASSFLQLKKVTVVKQKTMAKENTFFMILILDRQRKAIFYFVG